MEPGRGVYAGIAAGIGERAGRAVRAICSSRIGIGATREIVGAAGSGRAGPASGRRRHCRAIRVADANELRLRLRRAECQHQRRSSR